MLRLILTGYLAQIRAGKMLFLLHLLGVAIGVASVLSIQIINRNALAAFEGSVTAVSGDSDLSVFGNGPTFDEALLARTLQDPAVAAAYPIHLVEVTLRGDRDRFLDVIGLDFFSNVRIPWSEAPETSGDPLFTEGWAAVSPELADDLGWSRGDSFVVHAGSRVVPLTVGATVDFRRITPLAGTRMIVMDIAQAQAATGQRGQIHQIDIQLREGADLERARVRLQEALGSGVRLVSLEERRSEASGLLGAFRLNLTALSLISLLVGSFLVYSATQASLLRRRAEFGLMRCTGATQGQVVGVILTEVAITALLGIALGIPLGWLAAKWNVGVVSMTLSNLYLLEEIERLFVPLWIPVMAGVIGLLSAWSGALFPALEMGRRDTRELLNSQSAHDRIGARTGGLALGGLAVLGFSWLGYRMFLTGWQPAGFALGVALLVAIPMVTPWVAARVSARFHPHSLGVVYGIRSLGLRLQSSATAVAALAITITMLIGITLMIGSFRRTVTLWIGETLVADVYVTTESARGGQSSIDPEVVKGIESLESVEGLYGLRFAFAQVDGRRVPIAGTDFSQAYDEGAMVLIEGQIEGLAERIEAQRSVVISEPLARKSGLAVGDELVWLSPRGEERVPIIGINVSYGSENGSALMHARHFAEIYGTGQPSSLAVTLTGGADPEATVDAIKSKFSDVPLDIRSNQSIRDEVVVIFDQTFAVTRLLQVMSLFIAVAGIAVTLLVQARERASEIALYRALGATKEQIVRLFVGKGLGMALTGLSVGAVGGVILSLILVYRINRDYFGWTIAMHVPWGSLFEQTLLIIGTALLASLYPAFRAGATPAAELSRDAL